MKHNTVKDLRKNVLQFPNFCKKSNFRFDLNKKANFKHLLAFKSNKNSLLSKDKIINREIRLFVYLLNYCLGRKQFKHKVARSKEIMVILVL